MKEIRKIIGSGRIIPFLSCIFLVASLQGQNSYSIKAAATVVETAGIELITLKDITIDEASAQNGILQISPLSDDKAGKMLVKGKSNSSIRLSYMNQLALQNTTGQGSIVFKYVVSGNKSDNQQASQPLDQIERIVQFNEKGEYYLWLGGEVNLSNAKPGSYDGEFTIQIEYI
jgi:hypothetical protein